MHRQVDSDAGLEGYYMNHPFYYDFIIIIIVLLYILLFPLALQNDIIVCCISIDTVVNPRPIASC